MSFFRKALLGEYSLGFTFWVMGGVVPTPIFAAKYFLREAGVFTHVNPGIHLAGQAFLWLEWLCFALITVALWNASSRHLERAKRGEPGKPLWGHLGRLTAAASGVLALGSFSNLSGLTTLILGRPIYLGMGGG